MDIPSFILASLALLLTPGPTNTLLAAAGAIGGLRRSMSLPMAEAAGYAITISIFHATLDFLAPNHGALAATKGMAAIWLMYAALSLWAQPAGSEQPQDAMTFRRILVTTVLNPKAMIVGTLLVPNFMPTGFPVALALFLTLSMFAGGCWIALGSALPAQLRKHGYRAAALILCAFSVVAAYAALQG